MPDRVPGVRKCARSASSHASLPRSTSPCDLRGIGGINSVSAILATALAKGSSSQEGHGTSVSHSQSSAEATCSW